MVGSENQVLFAKKQNAVSIVAFPTVRDKFNLCCFGERPITFYDDIAPFVEGKKQARIKMVKTLFYNVRCPSLLQGQLGKK